MKLLIDMNLSPDWVAYLAHQGIESTYWSDLDFGILLSLTQDTGPSVVQIRTLDTFPEAIGQRLVQTIRTYEPYLNEGALVTIDEQRQRVRVLPLRRNR
jgi:predicted nuclease of predicted toxin-antitoxin system